jgi:glycosyltransferase involved in cell wall biosynthesis|tara:strand:- start:6158 stop:7603 length:1446 start_codon:yes stop_codon:yes gene_type:complete
MNKELPYIPKEDRKKILLLCDDIRMHSGIATMAREFVVNSAQHFNWLNLGAAVGHQDEGKIFDLSDDINKGKNLTDSYVKILPSNGYGNAATVRQLIEKEKPDAIFIFTDPRYWIWLFDIEREIRSKIPIVWLNIWDDYPSPLYNKTYYNSVDALMAISKQTLNINKLVLEEEAENKVLKYIPHGIDETIFKPIKKEDAEFETFTKFREDLFTGKDIEFVMFYNSRNIQRKKTADVILAFRMFCDSIPKEKAKKCALVMHTAAVDPNGTDLNAVKEALCDPEYVNVYFSQDKINPAQMNALYNIADVTCLISSNEGWGLSLTESMMAGTMIIANVTGGMQDQMRFEKDGKWIDFDSDFPSNHRGTVKEHGEWAIPVFPSNISLTGSVPTPYIFDDRCRPEDAAQAILEAFNLSKEERDNRGLKGREWAMSDESGFTAKNMSYAIGNTINETIEKFIPRPRFDLIKIVDQPRKYIKHKLLNY